MNLTKDGGLRGRMDTGWNWGKLMGRIDLKKFEVGNEWVLDDMWVWETWASLKMDGNGGTMRERNFFKEKLNLKKDLLLHEKVENQNQFERIWVF